MNNEVTETASVTMTAKELRHISTVAHYAGSEDMLPVLGYVRLITTGDNCEATATDLYIMARMNVETVESSGENTILVPVESLTRAVGAFAKNKRQDERLVTIANDGHTVTITCNATADVIGAPAFLGTYPDVDSLIPAARGISEVASGICLNPHFLAKLAKLYPWNENKGTGAVIRTITDNSRPVLIQSPDEKTTVLQMPVRL